jgi:alkanesulfonate monooxygenase SsuD/methylene tetrahydromethanopterin reductase-like flavin-dependent oxidoreductase (luciferase family)
VCVWALAADTHEAAAHHALGRERWRVDRARGVLGPLQSPAEIAARGFDAAEEEGLAPMRARAFVGSIATVRERIERLVQQFALDELVVNTWAHDPAVRRTSYALLAESFGLTRAGRT